LDLYDQLVQNGILEDLKRNDIQEKENHTPTSVDSILEAIESDYVDEGVVDPLAEDDLEDKDFVLRRGSPVKMTSMTWTTPLGFPIVQPYRKAQPQQVKTHLQTFTIRDTQTLSPVNSMKQSSAFPPNFVHSLDASHMMLTSLSCHQSGLTFAAVHDSYWTHAADVDEMSYLLREAFIRLHSKNIIERLEQELYCRFGEHRIQISVPVSKQQWEVLGRKGPSKLLVWVPFRVPPRPERGEFQVSQVRHSTYFFH
jgi:DNA-directed RNA polymerase